MSFDGSACVKKRGGACSAIAWRLPTWTIVESASKYRDTYALNEAEYEGMLLGFSWLQPLERRWLIICGYFNLVVWQMRGEIEWKASGLSPLRARALNELKSWPSQRILHLKRNWNKSANQLASTAWHHKGGITSMPGEEIPGLEAINRLPELLVPKHQSSSTKYLR